MCAGNQVQYGGIAQMQVLFRDRLIPQRKLLYVYLPHHYVLDYGWDDGVPDRNEERGVEFSEPGAVRLCCDRHIDCDCSYLSVCGFLLHYGGAYQDIGEGGAAWEG